ncbi:MAG: discoidin domain-containing protein, partial [Burkholderiales bacterium]|nr:discoidin domain-containing protein [Opitutaceae bacterium]
APGRGAAGEAGEAGEGPGWSPLGYRRRATASSHAPGRVALYAVDQSMITWWQPADGDATPWIEIDLGPARFLVHALRLVWKDVGLDYKAGILPGPFRWRLSLRDGPDGAWRCVVVASDNEVDLLIDYRELAEPAPATRVRLEVTGWPAGLRPGLVDFAVFGQALR